MVIDEVGEESADHHGTYQLGKTKVKGAKASKDYTEIRLRTKAGVANLDVFLKSAQ